MSTDRHSVMAHVAAPTAADEKLVFCQMAGRAKADHAKFFCLFNQVDAEDVVPVMPIDHLASATRDLLGRLTTVIDYLANHGRPLRDIDLNYIVKDSWDFMIDARGEA